MHNRYHIDNLTLEEINYGNTFDYVVVGAGSSGCVMANRLSEDGTDTVLILEAGGKDTNMFIHMPS